MAISGKVQARLRNARGFVFDVDGTLVLGDRNNLGFRVLDGAIEVLAHLRARNIPVAVFTNGTVRTPDEYVVKLREAGLPIADGYAFTPSRVAADYFVHRGYRRVRVLGIEGVWRPIADAGIEVVREPGDQPVDAVFVGWYRQFHMEEIEAACNAVESGVPLYTGSLAPFFASAHGRVLSSSRVICSAIASITGKKAKVLGKPAPEALRATCRQLGVAPKDVVVVGDDPALEVYMARRGGALGIAVRTGVWKDRAVGKLPAQHRPDLALDSVAELLPLLNGRAR